MAVYVDDMRARYGRMVMCHMIADTDKELCDMAERIGVHARWHQGDHFDIALSKRALAVAAGAIEVTQKQAACLRAMKRMTGSMGSPHDVIERYVAHRKMVYRCVRIEPLSVGVICG